MSINNTFAKSFNVNHLKLTPEKLAEWDKRHSSNTLPLSQGEATTITSKYFNFSQQNQNQNDNEISQKHENLQDRNKLFPPLIDLQIDTHESIKTVEEKQSVHQMKLDNMPLDDNSRDQNDGFVDNLKDSENGMSLQEGYFENKPTDNDLEIGEVYDAHDKTFAQEQEFNPISENDKLKISSEEDSSKFLMITQNIVEKKKLLDQENTLHEEHYEHPLIQRDDNINDQEDGSNKQSDETSPNFDKTSYEEEPKSALHDPVFSNEKYNKMKESSRLRASNPNISHFMKTVMPNKKSDFDRDMEEILCDIEAYYELAQEGQLEVSQQLDYIERSLDSLNKEFNKYRVKLCDLRQEFGNQIQIDVLKESEEWEGVFDRIGSNIS